MALRRWAIEGHVPFRMVGGERPGAASISETWTCSPGQESSLTAQAGELAKTSVSQIIGVYADGASGFRENRPELTKLLKDAVAEKFTVVRVIHEDRLAPFGVGWFTMLLGERSVTVEIVHVKGRAGGMEGRRAEFMSLVATRPFARWMCGIRAQQARRRTHRLPGPARAKQHVHRPQERQAGHPYQCGRQRLPCPPGQEADPRHPPRPQVGH